MEAQKFIEYLGMNSNENLSLSLDVGIGLQIVELRWMYKNSC